ncbi:MAG: hypothetical protein KJ601_07495 [Nanoarchaeota archaeon]|nr:hypothetical protein [Nanoarchaeota archaeon]
MYYIMQDSEEKRGKTVDYSKLGSFTDEEVELFNDFLRYLREKKGCEGVPISIFKDNNLAPLEAVVKYLREEKNMSYKDIGESLNKNPGPLGVTYRKAKLKVPDRLNVSGDVSVPVEILRTNKSVFAAIVKYLKDNRNMGFAKIAELMCRNYRTIWTVYNRK